MLRATQAHHLHGYVLHRPSPLHVSDLRTEFGILPLDLYVYVETGLEQSEYPNLDGLR